MFQYNHESKHIVPTIVLAPVIIYILPTRNEEGTDAQHEIPDVHFET